MNLQLNPVVMKKDSFRTQFVFFFVGLFIVGHCVVAYASNYDKGYKDSWNESQNSFLYIFSSEYKNGYENGLKERLTRGHAHGEVEAAPLVRPIIILAVVGFAVGIAGLCGYTLGRRRRQIEENVGEAAVRKLLTKNFGSKDCHLLNNITLPFQKGTTQIDHILVSRAGVFVIETKHYAGWIFADASSQKWMQVLFHMKSRFQNPIHQNHKHLIAVRKVLDFLPSDDVRSIVVFTGKAEFKTPRPDGVLFFNELVDYIQSCSQEKMSENRMQFCVGRLETTRRLISRRTDVEHHAYLNSKLGNID